MSGYAIANPTYPAHSHVLRHAIKLRDTRVPKQELGNLRAEEGAFFLTEWQ